MEDACVFQWRISVRRDPGFCGMDPGSEGSLIATDMASEGRERRNPRSHATLFLSGEKGRSDMQHLADNSQVLGFLARVQG